MTAPTKGISADGKFFNGHPIPEEASHMSSECKVLAIKLGALCSNMKYFADMEEFEDQSVKQFQNALVMKNIIAKMDKNDCGEPRLATQLIHSHATQREQDSIAQGWREYDRIFD